MCVLHSQTQHICVIITATTLTHRSGIALTHPTYDPDDLDDFAPLSTTLAGDPAPPPAALAALRQEVEQARNRERAWRAVSDTARDLTVLREPSRVLQAIVERSRALLDSQVAWIAGPGPGANDTLEVLAIDGFSTALARTMRASRGRGVAGYVRRTRSPFSTSDYFSEDRVAHDPKIDATLRSEGVQSMVAVPMLSDMDFIGVLVLADRAARDYTHPEIATLTMLASHAVVAMLNARAHAQTQAALDQAEHANVKLQQQAATQEMAANAHERLTRLVAQGGTLPDVCGTAASLLDAQVVVVDAADGLLCSASPDGATLADAGAALSRWLSGQALHASLDDSRISGRSVALPGSNDGSCRLAAIVGGGRLLGGVLVRSAVAWSDVAVRTLERSALVMAVMLLAPERSADSPFSASDPLLIDLLHPLRAGSAGLAAGAAARGLRSPSTLVLALLDVAIAPGSAPEATTAAVVRRLRKRIPQRSGWVSQLDDRVVVLCHGIGPSELCQTLQRALAEAPAMSIDGLVSDPCDTLAKLPTAFAALHRGMTLVRALPLPNADGAAHGHGAGCGIKLAIELAPFAAAFGNSDVPSQDLGLHSYIDATIGELLAHDRDRNSALAPSLLMYLEHGSNAKSAADQLQVHVNTLNHRLAAAKALLGGWDASGRRLSLHLALKLNTLREAVPKMNLKELSR